MSCVSGVIKMKDVLDALLSFAAGDLRTEQWLSKEEQQEYVMARKHRGQQWDELWMQLEGEQKRILKGYGENSLTFEALEEQLFFCQGFAIGIKIAIACLR